MADPKMKACPRCQKTDLLDVFDYESGMRYVECVRSTCNYRGPGDTSVRKAIKRHNEHVSSLPASGNGG